MGGSPSRATEISSPFDFASRATSTSSAAAPVATSSDGIALISVFHPFPLRIDTMGNGAKIQYDACIQVGEFKTAALPKNSVVVLVPLKADKTPGPGASFVNAFANKIPGILGAQPDLLLGYPDVPAATGADWSIAQVINTEGPYYTWTNKDGTRVIVMADPILISEGDLTNIQRLPVTPPEDVIHEINEYRYKPGPPTDSKGNPIPCSGSTNVPQLFPGPSSVAMSKANKPSVSGTDWLTVILGIVASLVVFIGVWAGLKIAVGPGGTLLKSAGDWLGKTLAGGYGVAKSAGLGVRSGVGSMLGVGPTSARRFPPGRTRRNPPGGLTIRTPFAMTNPKYASKADFVNRRRTMRNAKRIPPGGLTIRTPAQVAQAPTPAGTPAALATVEPTNIPEPTGDFTMTNQEYASNVAAADRKRALRSTLRNLRSVNEIARRKGAEKNRGAQPAGTGLFDLGGEPTPIDEIAQRKPRGPGRVATSGPKESLAERLVRAKANLVSAKERKAAIEAKHANEKKAEPEPAPFKLKPIEKPTGILGEAFAQQLAKKKPSTEPAMNALGLTGKRGGHRRRRHKTGRRV